MRRETVECELCDCESVELAGLWIGDALEFGKGSDVMKIRRVLGGAQGVDTLAIRTVEEATFVIHLRLPLLGLPHPIAHHVKKERVVR